MNPYDFVRIDWNKAVERKPANRHHQFTGRSGRIAGTLTTLTPLFIPGSGAHLPKTFITNRQGQAIIPGTTLKGLVRSLVETIGPGCWWLFGGPHQNKLPRAFKQCSDVNNLCIACRMFGLINNSTLLEGQVNFDDAICKEPVNHPAIYTIILSSPKARHSAFYLDQQGNLAGRKFYFHYSEEPEDVTEWLPSGSQPYNEQNRAQNQYIKPIGPNSVFKFSMQFNNLREEELQLLLYALMLEPEIRHKVGYAKPAGLGSVEIKLTQLELIDYEKRYTIPSMGRVTYANTELEQFVSTQTVAFTSNTNSMTLEDLRRIWQWPGRDDLSYPSRQWFQQNSQKRLHQTP